MKPSDADITYAEHAADILGVAVALIRSGQSCALVASVAIEGGAAREVGSLAVVCASGAMTGYLSNGCIDRDIVLQGLEALEAGQVRHIRYGAGSPYMDLKLPCGGALELVIDPQPDLAALEAAHAALQARQAAELSFDIDRGLVPDSDGPLLFRYAPKPALVLTGRGTIFRTTAALATSMEFDLHLVSPDEVDLDSLAGLGAVSARLMTTPDRSPQLPVDRYTAVLLLFHDHEWEQAIVLAAAPKEPFFLGALGSMKTQARRLKALEDSGADAALCALVRGPIGLVPSLRSASQIAVSALAEVISAMPVAIEQVRPRAVQRGMS